MGLVSTWLSGIGLSYAWPTFEAAGIVTPAALANLDVTVFSALGVTDSEDRRKLFYLVQRIKLAVVADEPEKEIDSVASTVDQVLAGTAGLSNGHSNSHQLQPRSGPPDVTSTEEEDEDEEETPVQEARRVLTSKVSPRSQKQQPLGAPRSPQSKPQRTTSRNAPRTATRKDPTISPRVSPRNTKQSKPTMTARSVPGPTNSNSSGRTSRMVQPTPNGRTSLPQPSATKSRLPAKATTGRMTPATQKRIQSRQLREKDENQQTNVSTHRDDDEDVSELESPVNRDEDDYRHFDDETVNSVESSEPSNDGGIASRTRSARSRQRQQEQEQQQQRKKPSGLTPPRQRPETTKTTGIKTPATSKTPATRKTTSASRPKSNRTGKNLSVIHSDRILPMSPLMELAKSESAGSAKDSTEGNPTARRKAPERRNSNSSQNSNSSKNRRRRKQSGIPASDSYDHSDSEHSTQSARSHKSATSRTSVGRRKAAAKEESRGRPVNHRDNSSDPNSFKSQIEELREDHADEHALFSSEDLEAENEDMRIRVIVRKRPMSAAEVVAAGDVDVIHPLDYGSHGRILVYHPKTRVDLTKEIETIPFAFDNVFGEKSTNLQIYERTVRNLIPPLFEGQWGCVFAYGQTGSGKTFTMMGSNMTTQKRDAPKNLQNLGLYYMAALDIFQALSTEGFEHFDVKVSLFEIYGGKLFDLLNDRNQIKCLEDHDGKVRFPGLSEHALGSAEDLMAMIEEGACNRSTGSTSRNADSSRSHAVLQLHVYQPVMRGRRMTNRSAEFSRLTFIDLAGSERGADTSTSNRETRMEGAEINTSLLALKEVIRALATGDSMTHVPFRGSKLTQVLKESFVGEHCRSVMVACVSPNIGNCEQTLNTIRYANRVKERDPETGQLSGAVAMGRQEPRARRRSSSAKPTREEEVEAVAEVRRSESARVFRTQLDEDSAIDNAPKSPRSPTRAHLHRNRSDVESVTSANTDVLDDILDAPEPSAKAAQEVIQTHKDAMTTLLGMVKDEMALVNAVGANGMEEYIAAVNDIHEKQLNMFGLLRERIREYRELRATKMANGHVSEDEDVEDLRD